MISEMVMHAGRAGMLFAAVIKTLPRVRHCLPDVWRHAKRIADGLPLVLTMGAISGAVLAQQTSYQLNPGLPDSVIGVAVAAGVLTELGPVLTAIVLAGRIGAGTGAEIATMKVSDQIDALLTLGRDPVLELVTPRLLAASAMLPICVLLADCVGIAAGHLFSTMLLGVEPHQFLAGVKEQYHHPALIFSATKGFLFGIIIAFVSCYTGLQARGGAAGVGRTATSAVVSIIMWVMVTDAVIAPLYKTIATS